MELQRIKVEKNTNYTTINNTIIKDKTISLKAKGLFLTIMSLPNTWDFSVNGIAKILKEETRAVYSAINELIEHGYCDRNRQYENGKIKYWYYSFSEQPKQNLKELNLPEEKLDVENLQVEKLDVENETQLSKEGIKNLSNKVKNKEGGGALPIYREFFPHYQLSLYQQDLLKNTSVAVDEFRAAMRFWASRNYKERNVQGIINCYKNGSYKNQEQPKPKPKDDSGLYKTVAQLKAERENVIINLPPPRKKEVANV